MDEPNSFQQLHRSSALSPSERVRRSDSVKSEGRRVSRLRASSNVSENKKYKQYYNRINESDNKSSQLGHMVYRQKRFSSSMIHLNMFL
ncbi:hypothetical protein EB796_015650 [Bugula neritina]|uniref:Uncharacterized protein n=1 Tax=Bugula neritina TaxID=10212 RepID=A0A7J7JK91_BUGNE|nr:hypothetical protein EB796_015650 [Bugula neritina]